MSLLDIVENFFTTYNKVVSIKELMKKLAINFNDIDELIDVLYELELEGKILGNDANEYVHVPADFYMCSGVVHLSARNNFYINLANGGKIIISGAQTKELSEGDVVFVETKKSDKHRLQKYGTIKRIVKKAQIYSKTFLYKATIKKSNHNYYYVEINNHKFYIKELKGAFVGDLVTVSAYEENNNCVANVQDILKRKKDRHIFEFKNISGEYKWVPINGTYYPFNFKYPVRKSNPGDLALFEIDNDNNATYIQNVDNSKTLYTQIKNLAYDAGLDIGFSSASLEEAQNIDGTIKEEDIKSRVDLRDLVTITIDPSRAKDLDDAVSLEVLEDRFRLYVSIADVSHYVKLGSEIFKEAAKKGTSCYPPNYVFPMLPERLSSEICSINPGEDKLAITGIIDVDRSGNILDYQIVKSVINSNYKMSYDKVNNLLDGVRIEPEYAPFYRLLTRMNELSNILQQRRLARGFISFESGEIQFDVNSEGQVLGVSFLSKGQAQLLIENFMVLFNEIIAEYAFNLDIPFVYRNHESPDINKIKQLKYKLSGLKKYLHALTKVQNPKIMQNIFLHMCEGKTEPEIIYLSKIFLRNMKRANYDICNIGHYGLALSYYATFTSPIRRLPDLLNHMMISYLLEGRYDELDTFIDLLAELAMVSTEKQKEAEEFERMINNILLQRYADDFIGEVITGHIIFIVDNLVYIETKEGLYGYMLVKKGDIKQNTVRLNNNIYVIGNPIRVKVEGVKPQDNEFIFTYAGELENEFKLEKRNR